MTRQCNDETRHDVVQDGTACPSLSRAAGYLVAVPGGAGAGAGQPHAETGQAARGVGSAQVEGAGSAGVAEPATDVGLGAQGGQGSAGQWGDWVQWVRWGLGALVGLGTPGTRLGVMGGQTGCHRGLEWVLLGVGLGATGQGVRSVLGGLDWVPQGSHWELWGVRLGA